MLEPRKSALLLTDIDGSIYSECAPVEVISRLHSFCRAMFDIVYLTGRTQDSVLAMMGSGALPPSALTFCDLGVTLLRGRQRRGNPLLLGHEINHADREQILEAARSFRWLRNQVILDNRLSFVTDQRGVDLDAAVRAMARTGVDVFVSDRYLDVLPKGVNKGTAAQLVLDRHGHAYDRVVLIGDSANDLHLAVRVDRASAVRLRVGADGGLRTLDKERDIVAVDGIHSVLPALEEALGRGSHGRSSQAQILSSGSRDSDSENG